MKPGVVEFSGDPPQFHPPTLQKEILELMKLQLETLKLLAQSVWVVPSGTSVRVSSGIEEKDLK